MCVLEMSAPSKINLQLCVLGRRPDGFHDIETIFLPLKAPCDSIRIEDSDGGVQIVCSHPDVPTDSGNLCHKAATLVREAAGASGGWIINIEKRIPVAGGMGGGSSDAAAVLNLLGKRLGCPDAELRRLALRIGSDVPFFLDPRPSVGRGRGEILESTPLGAPLHLVLMCPHFPVSAAWAYKHFDREKTVKTSEIGVALAALASGCPAEIAATVRNDLSHALWAKFPFLSILADELRSEGALVVEVSGSGPTLFGVFHDELSASAAASTLSARLVTEGVSIIATSAFPHECGVS